MRLVYIISLLFLSSVTLAFTGAEVHSPNFFFQQGQSYQVTWRAQPTIGNCAISVFSLFNADDLYGPDGYKTNWSEIAFETFGGSALLSDEKSFQTQYITALAPGPQRGKLHSERHTTDQLSINIFDGKKHNFTVIWKHVNTPQATLIYQIDGHTIRTIEGEDVPLLHSRVNIYAGTWVTEEGHSWACTSNEKPKAGEVALEFIDVEYELYPGWSLKKRILPEEIQQDWIHSNWGFVGFDGTYTPDNVMIKDRSLILELKE